MLRELASFSITFSCISGQESLKARKQEDIQLIIYFACSSLVIRFLEGKSWGYSDLLMHETLDKEIKIALLVTFNLLQRIKQSYREDKEIGPSQMKNDDVTSKYSPEPIFQKTYNLNMLDKLICMSSNEEIE